MKLRRRFSLALGIATLLSGATAEASTATGSLFVGLTITATCSVNDGSAAGGPGALSVACSNATPYRVGGGADASPSLDAQGFSASDAAIRTITVELLTPSRFAATRRPASSAARAGVTGFTPAVSGLLMFPGKTYAIRE